MYIISTRIIAPNTITIMDTRTPIPTYIYSRFEDKTLVESSKKVENWVLDNEVLSWTGGVDRLADSVVTSNKGIQHKNKCMKWYFWISHLEIFSICTTIGNINLNWSIPNDNHFSNLLKHDVMIYHNFCPFTSYFLMKANPKWMLKSYHIQYIRCPFLLCSPVRVNLICLIAGTVLIFVSWPCTLLWLEHQQANSCYSCNLFI